MSAARDNSGDIRGVGAGIAEVMFSGDLIDYNSGPCYCGDAILREWPPTHAEPRSAPSIPKDDFSRRVAACAQGHRTSRANAIGWVTPRIRQLALYGAAANAVRQGPQRPQGKMARSEEDGWIRSFEAFGRPS